MKNNSLKFGYSTGTHATSALKVALLAMVLNTDIIKSVSVALPDDKIAKLQIESIVKFDDYIQVSVVKSDNDDVDVTKGCRIICKIANDLSKIAFNKHELDHKPYILEVNKTVLHIFAGEGLGIVTKKGLNSPVGYPAINATPLEMMKKAFEEVIANTEFNEKTLYAVFEVENGLEIAKNTINAKVGIIGGISFLGKRGIVKPISTEAYFESLAQEIKVAAQNPTNSVVFTIGNSALNFAHKKYNLDQECFIEIGNFIFDSLKILKDYNFSKLIIVTSIGKLTKIAQEKKNTNNRYGSIDFEIIGEWLLSDFPKEIITIAKKANTVAEIEEFITNNHPDFAHKFYNVLLTQANKVIMAWLDEIGVKKLELEIVLADKDKMNSISSISE